MIDANTGLTLNPIKKLSAAATWHFFWRASENDALYNAGGGVVRTGDAASGSWVGSEIDLTAKYAVDSHTAAFLGYSHFFAGDFIARSGSSEDIDFVYLQLQYTF